MPREYRPYWIDKRAEVRFTACTCPACSLSGTGCRGWSRAPMSRSPGWRLQRACASRMGTSCLGEFEEIGRIRGRIVRWLPEGFAIAFDHDPAREAALAEDLERL